MNYFLTGRNEKVVLLLIFVLSLFVYTRDLGSFGIEFRDDEVFYYQSSREMLEAKNYLSPTYFGKNRFEKPILFYWMVIAAFKALGINWISARIISVIFASLTACLIYVLAKELYGRREAFLSSLILMSVPLFFRHAKNVVPDMTLVFFISLAMYALIKNVKHANGKYSLLFFASCGIGFMIKGYSALIIPFLALISYLIAEKDLTAIRDLKPLRGIIILALIISPWFIYMFLRHGNDYVNHMIVTETKNRVLASSDGWHFFSWAQMFLSHLTFYLRTILSYFAPWGLFFFLGCITINFKRLDSGHKLLFLWTLITFLFFSSIYFRINHYLLTIAVPFSIIASAYLSTDNQGRILYIAVKFILRLAFAIAGFIVLFLFLYISDESKYNIAF
ncbi:MAG: glycosyltransferase family 39 protein, partial [Candidatus Omnitrophica bacterium]|nr:glycosyltransferase family 39 protein [Candidatus Omnitrophota bacterium]